MKVTLVVMAEALKLPCLFILVFLEVSFMHISDLLNEVTQTPNHHRQSRRIPAQSNVENCLEVTKYLAARNSVSCLPSFSVKSIKQYFMHTFGLFNKMTQTFNHHRLPKRIPV